MKTTTLPGIAMLAILLSLQFLSFFPFFCIVFVSRGIGDTKTLKQSSKNKFFEKKIKKMIFEHFLTLPPLPHFE